MKITLGLWKLAKSAAAMAATAATVPTPLYIIIMEFSTKNHVGSGWETEIQWHYSYIYNLDT